MVESEFTKEANGDTPMIIVRLKGVIKMKRVYDAPIMRPATMNSQENLKFTIIGA